MAVGGGAGGAPAGRAVVVVLGDVGRSPRMQYHAVSLADEAGMEVDLVGQPGAPPHERVTSHPRIRLRYLSNFPIPVPRGPLFLLVAPLKVAFQVLQLLLTLLFVVKKPDVVLLQNPPAIPTLLIALLAARLRGSRLVIDWHNYGYTLLGMSLGASHPLVLVARWYERTLGRLADGGLCVTAAMQADLRDNWGVSASVLYDRAPEFFRRLEPAEQHDLFVRLHRDGFLSGFRWADDEAEGRPAEAFDGRRTLFTERAGADGQVQLRADRPALVVSSTSWTADEDFGILLEAIREVEARASGPSGRTKSHQSGAFPRVLFVITGRGPMREQYEARIAALGLRRTKVLTAFLAAEDYPRLLGSADLGVSLHTSSSGLDLPMKVVDMFGCGLPVCAVGFSCLPELVKDGRNGRVFSTSAELANQMIDLLDVFPAKTPALDSMRSEVTKFQAVRWNQNWREVALPVLIPGPSAAGVGKGKSSKRD